MLDFWPIGRNQAGVCSTQPSKAGAEMGTGVSKSELPLTFLSLQVTCFRAWAAGHSKLRGGIMSSVYITATTADSAELARQVERAK